ncbi:MAG: hypothetical protein U9Q91_06910 [Candidatus Marinimicrobia bacterium]|nr:hypothetical protein [Candidatus Neomarinimicrobiota bacterium]
MRTFFICLMIYYVGVCVGQSRIQDDERYQELMKFRGSDNLPNDSIILRDSKNEIYKIIFSLNDNLYIGKEWHSHSQNYLVIEQLKKAKDTFISNGSFIQIDPYTNIIVSTGEYRNGKLHGKYCSYRNEKLDQVVEYKKGHIDGIFKLFYDNGNVKEEGFVKKGNNKKTWKYYYPNGVLKSQGYYSKNYYYDSSNVDTVVIDGYTMLMEKPLKIWFKKGRWKYYNENGVLIKTELYRNEELIKTEVHSYE